MSLAEKHVLVTGGAGFIGSHIVDALRARGARVTVFDDFSSGRADNLPPEDATLRIVRGDVRDLAAVRRVCEGVDLISHQAAQLEIIRCLDHPGVDLDINTKGTLHVLQAAADAGVERVVYASSACVYGQAHEALQREEHPKAPNWPYGVSKLAGELYASLYAETHGLASVGLRYSIVYGPREWYGRVLTAFLARAMRNEPPVMWGQGQAVRDFVYVDDVVELNMLALESELPGAKLLNASTGVGTSVQALAELVRNAASIREPAICEDLAEGEVSTHVAGRRRLPAELRHMVLDPARAAELFGWRPHVKLAEGLVKQLAWLRQCPERWTTMRY